MTARPHFPIPAEYAHRVATIGDRSQKVWNTYVTASLGFVLIDLRYTRPLKDIDTIVSSTPKNAPSPRWGNRIIFLQPWVPT